MPITCGRFKLSWYLPQSNIIGTLYLILPVEINCHITGKKKGAVTTAPLKFKSLVKINNLCFGRWLRRHIRP